MPSISVIFEAVNAKEVSSANILVILNSCSAISFINIRKNKGPKTDP